MAPSAQAQDVSNYQGRYDWVGAKAGIANLVLGITRVVQGLGAPGTGSPDPDAAWDWQQLHHLGLDQGGYAFLDPTLDGPAQARYLVDTTDALPGGVGPRTQFWLDNETDAGLHPARVAEVAVAFMAELDTLVPYNPRGAYTFTNFALDGYCAGLGAWPLWLATRGKYTVPPEPPPWFGPEFVLWQWGSRDGTDADSFLGTVDEYNAWVASWAQPPPDPGPFRHVSNGLHSLETLAARRHNTAEALLATSIDHYTPEDLAALTRARIPRGVPYYTVNP